MRDNRNNTFQDEILIASWVNILFSQKYIEACDVPEEAWVG